MKPWKRIRRCYEKKALDCIEENITGRQKRIDFSITLLPAKKGPFLDIGSADGLLLETVGHNVRTQRIEFHSNLRFC